MDHRTTEPASAVIGHPAAEDAAPIAKGDPEIMLRLAEALSYRRALPAFSRGRMFYDFKCDRVRIAPHKDSPIT
jgi:hypothetical protein